MRTILGLDIGTNSVGSAWIDTEAGTVELGVGIFPAGVDEKPDGSRGAPINQKRRQVRAQRRSIRRRALRKQQLRRLLNESGLLPSAPDELQLLFSKERFDPWTLRRDGLSRELTPFEFGRVLLHMAQRRGALGVDAEADEDAGKVKEAIDRLRQELDGRTVGQFMADMRDERRDTIQGTQAETVNQPIRNRLGEFRWHADRQLVREEFDRLWQQQSQYDGPLAALLTDDLRQAMDDDAATETWRHRGALFGQRQTYWDTGTLGRCDLEPSDHQCPKCDMDAQEFLVREYVNNLRIDRDDGKGMQLLTDAERENVVDMLRREEKPTISKVKKELKADAAARRRQGLPNTCKLNVEVDAERKLNADDFYRTFVHGVFGEDFWNEATSQFRDDVNRTILRFDPQVPEHEGKLRSVAERFWKLDEATIDAFVEGWKDRPKKDTRVKLSRRAIRNLLPYLRKGLSISEARKEFAENPESGATRDQRARYAMAGTRLTKADRHYMAKHPHELPPAPNLSNPVVRKAIHEVRRHVNAWIKRKGEPPECIVVELAREASQPTKVRNEQLARNRRRDVIRKKIVEKFSLENLRKNQQSRAIERVLLCRQQRGVSAYSGKPITERMAADGTDLEIDHIVPRSRSQDNSMANRVLVFRSENRDKGNKTVKEWKANDPVGFGTIEQALRHLTDGTPDPYFTPRECSRKWENLHRDAPSTDEFHSSQLTDTAYAARQVVGYLKNALYADAPEGRRYVFTTKGKYTAILRRDWGLMESLLEQDNQLPGRSLVPVDDRETAHGESGVARRGLKDRRDHIHHAIDAVVVAFCREEGQVLSNLAHAAKRQEEAHAEGGYWPSREAVPPPQPWKTIDEFRQCVIDAAKDLVISHRAVKRRLVEAFHEETLLGPVVNDLAKNERHRTEDPNTLFTKRISAERLTSNHLRVPDGWAEERAKLDTQGLTKAAKKAIRRRLNAMADPRPTKSGIVRDRELRDQIRRCLTQNAVDPDSFDANELKSLVDNGAICMDSGVPIKRVILLVTATDPVRIDRRHWDESIGKSVPSEDRSIREREQRIYVGGSNFHIEIREDAKTGKWSGIVVTTFESAKRVRQQKLDAVDRSQIDGKDFVMSLSEGETLFCRRADRPDEPASYFIVAKLDRKAGGRQDVIHFAPHWDARRPLQLKKSSTDEDRAAAQDRWSATSSTLRGLGQEPDEPPYKVQVGPLGDVQRRND